MPNTAARHLAAVFTSLLPVSSCLRAGDGARTRDIKLGRLALYQLSYSRVRSARHLRSSIPGAFATGRPRTIRDGGGRIRTFEGLRRQIYSLLPLATWVPHPAPRCRCLPSIPAAPRADGENRTRNRLITNQVLCQLSYVSTKRYLRETRRIKEPIGGVKPLRGAPLERNTRTR